MTRKEMDKIIKEAVDYMHYTGQFTDAQIEQMKRDLRKQFEKDAKS